MALSLADALVQALVECNVTYVFGVSGANIEHLHDAIHRHRPFIQSVMAKCESGAAFMADAYARVHHRLGVCCSTSGGGMANLIPGILEAYSESVPLLAIIGEPPTTLQGRGAFQDSSGLGRTTHAATLFQTMAKYVAEIRDPNQFWKQLESAIVQALSGRPGPSILLIPRDLYDVSVPLKPNNFFAHIQQQCVPPEPNPEEVERLLHTIQSAQCPVLLLGHGVYRSGNLAAITNFCQKTLVPTATTLSSKGCIPEQLPNWIGMVGACGHPSAHDYIANKADLLVVVGSGMGLMNRGPLEETLQQTPTIFINIADDGITRRYPKSHLFQRDAAKTFVALNQILDDSPWHYADHKPHSIEYFEPIIASPLPALENTTIKSTLLQSQAIGLLQQVIPEKGHLIFDAGNCAATALHYLSFPAGVRSTIALGMGGMGYAVGGAIGIQMGYQNQERTVAFIGDGAFLMCGLEMHTAIDLQLPILFIIFNNNKHGMCVTRQQLFFEGRIECATYRPTRIHQIAFGIGDPKQMFIGFANSPQALQNQIDLFLEKPYQTGILELLIDIEEIPPFTPFLKPNAKRKHYSHAP